MNSITLVSSTNREDAVTRIVTDIYASILVKLGVKVEIVDLQHLPEDFVFSALYENAGTNPAFNDMRELMAKSQKFVFLVPEYNGSFPGVLKAFIDGLKFPTTFTNKKCALVGVSSGIQGGGLALSHLTDIFNYCGMHVLALKPKLARIELNLKEEKLTNSLYQELLETQAKQLIDF
ncbi:MAG: NADPH-dependent FMN reductase [Candidatus Cyclobacteriaceae bacterium M2_1C_046]